MFLFLEYPKCSTCRKAKTWLDHHQIRYTARHIAEQNPTAQELAEWVSRGALPLKKLWNTSGLLYREMGLKEKLPEMDVQSQLDLLATNGMLVKRPVLVGDDFVLAGFRPDEWSAALGL